MRNEFRLPLQAAFCLVLLAGAGARADDAPPPEPQIVLPDMLAVELPRGMTQIGPADAPLRDLLAQAHSSLGKVTSDLQHKVGMGPVRVTFSAWSDAPGSGKPAATRVARLFILPTGTTPVGVTGDENGTGGNNVVHIARDATGRVHMIYQDGGRPGGRTGAVYRRASVGPDGSVHFDTGPVYIADDGPANWNAYPALAVSGRDVQLVWQGGETVRTRRISLGANGWEMGPIIDTGAKSGGRDVGPAIAFDGKGGLHLVTPDGVYAFSGDGGKSWKSEEIPLPPNEKIKTESLAVDSAGIVHVSFTAPVTRPDPPTGKQGGYWQLRTVNRMPNGSWSDPTDVLAGAPAWKELHGPDDMLADWTRIAADNHGGLHMTWHGTAVSHAFSHDSAFYAWKKAGAPWSIPVQLVHPDPARGIKYSFAPSLALDGDRALAMVFYDVWNGADYIGFDTSLALLQGGKMQTLLPITQYVHNAIAAKHPETAMGSRFPAVAPAVWQAGGKTWLDVLETFQSSFEPKDPNLVVYQRLDLTGILH